MTTVPKFSIITTCKGRLDHLKQTLPTMVRQENAEVIVVDFSCPQNSASYVQSNYPSVRVVRLENKKYYAHCEARNAGAAVAQGEWLLFCDADIVLDGRCTEQLGLILKPGCFGKFKRGYQLDRHRPSGESGLGANNLEGFQVVQRSVFERLRGYDSRLRGYGAGGDTEFYKRAMIFGLRLVYLDETLVDRVIEHSDELRQTHAPENWLASYLRGSYYNWLKLAFCKLRERMPSDEMCDGYFKACDDATSKVLAKGGSVDVSVVADARKLPLAQVAGYGEATLETIVTVRVTLRKP